MASLTDRMMRAAKLDISLYEEVEADKGAIGQAMTVVILSSVAAGIGTIGTIGLKGLILGTIAAIVGWFIWAYLTYASLYISAHERYLLIFRGLNIMRYLHHMLHIHYFRFEDLLAKFRQEFLNHKMLSLIIR